MAISHIYKDACGLAQAKGLPSLIYHEPAIAVKFMRGAAGTTRILTILCLDSLQKCYNAYNSYVTEGEAL